MSNHEARYPRLIRLAKDIAARTDENECEKEEGNVDRLMATIPGNHTSLETSISVKSVPDMGTQQGLRLKKPYTGTVDS